MARTFFAGRPRAGSHVGLRFPDSAGGNAGFVTDQTAGASTAKSWDRWRRPLALVLALVFAATQWDRLSSGEPFAIATGIGVVCFLASMLWRRPTPPPELRASADAWRERARAGVWFFGVWFAVACIWLATAALFYEVQPLNFIVPVVPAVLAATNLLTLRGADNVAAMHGRAEAAASSTQSGTSTAE
jgi:hypothetical protein